MVVASQLVGRISIEGDDAARKALESIYDATESVRAKLTDSLSEAADQASAALTDMATDVSDASDSIRSTDAAMNAFSARLLAMTSPITRFVQRIRDGFGQVVTNIKTKLSQAIQPVVAFRDQVRARIDSVVSVVKSRFAQMTAPVIEFGNRVRQAAQPVINFGQKVASALAPLRSFAGRVGDAGRAIIANFGEKTRNAVQQTVSVLKLGLVGLGVAIASTIPAAGNFEETMDLIGASNDLAAKDVDKLSKAVLALGTDVRKGPQDLADGLYYVMGAGYKAGDAMAILKKSAQQAAVGMTDTQVVANAATAVLKSFPALDTARAFDIMTKSVFTGKTEWKDYAPAIGEVAQIAKFAGVSFEEATSALSTLTNVMPSTAEASTSLQALLQTSSSFSTLADRARGLGLAFDENTYKSLNLVDRLKYLQEVTGGNTEAMAKLLGREEALPAITALLSEGAKDYSKNLQDVTNSAGAADEAFRRTGEGAKASWARATSALESLQIKIGTALLPLVDLFSEKLVPLITRISDWITESRVLENILSTTGNAIQNVNKFVGNFTGTGNALMPLLAGIGAILLTLLVPAVWSLAAGVIMATWPFLLIGAAVAGLTAIFLHFYNSNAGFKAFIDNIGKVLQDLWNTISSNFMPTMQNLGNILQNNVGPALQNIGNFLVSTFKPAWDQLVTTFQTQLVPAWNQFMAALQPAMPFFQLIGAIILGVLIFALGLLVGYIVGMVTAIGGALPGIIQAFGGIVQFISGIVQVILSIVSFFVHLFTGQFDKLGGDLGKIWDGIVMMFQGAWNFIAGIFKAAWGLISGYVSGFISSIIKFFTDMWNKLVGHSIIPDMINGIINWFFRLPGRVGEAVASMVSKVMGKLNNLASDALNAGSNIVNNIAQGIRNAIGNVANAIGSVAQYIKDHLPHSPAKIGPLRYLEEQGTEITSQIATGMLSGLPQLRAALGDVVGPISSTMTPGATTTSVQAIPTSLSAVPVSSGGSNGIHVHVYWDGQDVTNRVMTRVQTESRKGPIR